MRADFWVSVRHTRSRPVGPVRTTLWLAVQSLTCLMALLSGESNDLFLVLSRFKRKGAGSMLAIQECGVKSFLRQTRTKSVSWQCMKESDKFSLQSESRKVLVWSVKLSEFWSMQHTARQVHSLCWLAPSIHWFIDTLSSIAADRYGCPLSASAWLHSIVFYLSCIEMVIWAK